MKIQQSESTSELIIQYEKCYNTTFKTTVKKRKKKYCKGKKRKTPWRNYTMIVYYSKYQVILFLLCLM